MNINLLKIIEQLGYTYEFKYSSLGNRSIIIYDENHEALTKELVNDEIYCGMRYKSKSGNVIHLDNCGVLEMKIGHQIKIKADNLHEDSIADHFVLYFQLDESTNYALSFYIANERSFNPKDFIYICTWIDTPSKNDYRLKLAIGANGATISKNNIPVESVDIEKVSTATYYRTVVDFIRKYVENDTEVDIEKGFSLVSPSVISMIDGVVEKNEYNIYNSRRK